MSETTPRRFTVSKAGSPVLEIVDAPGPLTSTASPPRDHSVATHSFLTAAARDPFSENTLREILGQSASTDDYVARLREAGFDVTQD